jgi:phytoene desaturase
MNSKKTVLVIGAGLGGIAAAARLAQKGFEVLVIEKNPMPGGRCGQLIQDGHRFDTGPTLLLIPDIYEETYTHLGECLEDHLDLRRIDPTYRFHFSDGTELSISADLNKMQAEIEAIEPGSFSKLLRYLAEGERHYSIAVKDLVGRNFYTLFEYFSPKNLSLLFKLKVLVNHYKNIEKYFQHPYLKAAFTFQNMYLGLSPFEAPATYSLLQYTELVDGVWFPVGGMYSIVKSLISIAKKHGVKFLYDSPVKEIEVENGTAKRIILQNGSRFNADVIVANADLPYVYESLLPDANLARKFEGKNYTCSAVMFYWGVDKTYPQLETHNLFVAGDYRRSFDLIFKDYSLPTAPNFYLHAPTRSDPSAAPPGQDTLMVLVPAGRLDKSNGQQDWKAMQSRARKAVFERLSKLGMADLKDHLKFEISYTPRNWLNMYNIQKGAAFGSINHNFLQVGYLRPQNQHPRYSNLFFVGGSTHPGNGVPLVLKSAQLTTERIIEKHSV